MRNIMIVDDDEEDCDLLTDAIKTVDSTIDCVKVFSGEKAIDLLATDYRPDFIFLDINMPVSDGKKCLAEIGKNEAKNDIPVIIYTTSKRKVDIEETHDLGAVHFITKPTALKELCDEISFVLDKGWEK
jgi:CheY-like chemotaxis protein